MSSINVGFFSLKLQIEHEQEVDHFLRRHRRRRLLHRLAAHQVRTRRPLPWQPRRRQPRPERQPLQDERELVKNLAGPEGRFSIAPLFSNDLKNVPRIFAGSTGKYFKKPKL